MKHLVKRNPALAPARPARAQNPAGRMHSLSYMITLYHMLSASTLYFFGFMLNGQVYAYTAHVLPRSVLRIEKGSEKNGGYTQVKFRPTVAWKTFMVESGRAVWVASEADFMALEPTNKGHKFEKWVTETYTDEIWVRDTVRFDKAGDVIINGENVQVKFEKAEVINEGSLRNAYRERA